MIKRVLSILIIILFISSISVVPVAAESVSDRYEGKLTKNTEQIEAYIKTIDKVTFTDLNTGNSATLYDSVNPSQLREVALEKVEGGLSGAGSSTIKAGKYALEVLTKSGEKYKAEIELVEAARTGESTAKIAFFAANGEKYTLDDKITYSTQEHVHTMGGEYTITYAKIKLTKDEWDAIHNLVGFFVSLGLGLLASCVLGPLGGLIVDVVAGVGIDTFFNHYWDEHHDENLITLSIPIRHIPEHYGHTILLTDELKKLKPHHKYDLTTIIETLLKKGSKKDFGLKFRGVSLQ